MFRDGDEIADVASSRARDAEFRGDFKAAATAVADSDPVTGTEGCG